MNSLQNLKNLYNQRLGKLEAITNSLTACDNRVKELTVNEDTCSRASLFLQSLSDTARVQVIEKISKLVTEVLQAVKDPNLEFRMILGVERGQPDLKFILYDAITQTEMSILDSCGGGVADLTAIALRIALLCKWAPAQERILILDEVGKFISAKDQENLSQFIRKLSETLNCQFIWISHSTVLASAAHKAFEVVKENGISKVTERFN